MQSTRFHPRILLYTTKIKEMPCHAPYIHLYTYKYIYTIYIFALANVQFYYLISILLHQVVLFRILAVCSQCYVSLYVFECVYIFFK